VKNRFYSRLRAPISGQPGFRSRAKAAYRAAAGRGFFNIWRRLLHRVVGEALRTGVGVAARRGQRSGSGALPGRSEFPQGALLVGHPYAVLGRAEDIRTAACALDIARVPFAMNNLFGDYGYHWLALHKDFPLMHRVDQDASFRANIFVLNADEMRTAKHRYPEKFLDGRYNIGYWAWELAEFPDAWVPALAGLHEIWAPSRFVQQAIAAKAGCPVIWMPLAVEPEPAVKRNRSDLGLPENRFLFLFFFDFRSFVSRKNPGAVIRAFEGAFNRSDESVGLVIKTNGMEECPAAYREFLDETAARDPRIVTINRVMDSREIRALVKQCDCFVSLHRSEGFGRGLAEAMYMGKPVIATGYSGNLDFMNESNSFLVDYALVPVAATDYPHGDGQLWADADVEMASAFMGAVAGDRGLARRVGASGAYYIRRFHSYRRVGARYRRRLAKLGLLMPEP